MKKFVKFIPMLQYQMSKKVVHVKAYDRSKPTRKHSAKPKKHKKKHKKKAQAQPPQLRRSSRNKK